MSPQLPKTRYSGYVKLCIAILSIPALVAQAQTLRTLYEFPEFPGYTNQLSLTSSRIFGVTSGNIASQGVFFELLPPTVPRNPWTQSVLYTFNEGYPSSGLAPGRRGVYYGTMAYGGANGVGGVYELTPPVTPGDAWIFRLLYSFSTNECPPYGCLSTGVPTTDGSGNVYVGVQGVGNCGSVIELLPPLTLGSAWTKITIFSFPDDASIGCNPNGSMQIDSNGVVWGTADNSNLSVVYSLSPPSANGGSWMGSLVHQFKSTSIADGNNPVGGLTLGPGGILYGTTTGGGTENHGVVFEVSTGIEGPPQYTVIHSFSGADGAHPEAPPVVGGNGRLYGPAMIGGQAKLFQSGFGTIYELSPPSSPGAPWTETTLVTFTNGVEGGHPGPKLSFSPAGVLYGATISGGETGNGTVFSLTP